MATIQEAIEYSKKNPTSAFANELKRRIESGQMDSELQSAGLTQYLSKPTEPSLASKLGERAKTAGKEVLNLATLGATSVSPQDVQEARNGQGELVALQAVNRAAQAPIRIAGAVGGAIGDVVGAGLQATGLDKPIAEAISPIVQSQPVQQGIQAFNALPQDTQDVLGAIGNAANIPLAGGVKSVAQAGAQTSLKTAGKVGSKVVAKVTPTAERATENTYKGIMGVVENKKSLLNGFKKSEGTGKDPVRVIAENPDYMVKINPEAKTIDATDAITHMKRDIEDYSIIRDNVLTTADQTLPPIPTNNIIRDVSSKFSAKNYSTYLDEGERAVKEVITKLQTLKKYNPETVSRVQLNEIRQGLDDTINSFTDTKLKDSAKSELLEADDNVGFSVPASETPERFTFTTTLPLTSLSILHPVIVQSHGIYLNPLEPVVKALPPPSTTRPKESSFTPPLVASKVTTLVVLSVVIVTFVPAIKVNVSAGESGITVSCPLTAIPPILF